MLPVACRCKRRCRELIANTADVVGMLIMFGLNGEIGDSMREADLSVYHGVPFAKTTGRKRVSKVCSNMGNISIKEKYFIIASYWRDKIRDESKSIVKKKLKPLRFIFNKADLEYYASKQKC